jgi:hypothetical protein
VLSCTSGPGASGESCAPQLAAIVLLPDPQHGGRSGDVGDGEHNDVDGVSAWAWSGSAFSMASLARPRARSLWVRMTRPCQR